MLIGTDPGADSLTAERLHEALAEGATVVTATRRLARRVLSDDAAGRSEPSWPTADVLPWGAWVGRAYRDLRDHGLIPEARPVLDESQAAVLWESVVADDARARDLLMAAGAAAECRDAWRLVHDWQLGFGELHARGGEDCRRFVALAREFRARLDAMGFVDPERLPVVVARHADQLPETRVIFHGFERLPAAHRQVISALGARAALALPPDREGTPGVRACADPAAELRAAVAWARSRLAVNPAARIGIVVPELDTHAARLGFLLDEALTPNRLFPAGMDAPRPWNLSLGRPLAEAPAVAAALSALSAGAGELEGPVAGRLLRSPYLAGADAEASSRAALDAWLRKEGVDVVPAGRLAAWARGGAGGGPCTLFGAGLSGLLDALWGSPRRRAPSAWAEAFARALRAVGWPGDAPLDSEEYQATGAWAELLDGLARLDPVLGPQSFPEALARVRRMAAERMFQPESGDAPVQVLGLLETPGQTFDALWVAGLHDGVLPAPLSPCPLIPPAIQRERAMPRACPRAEEALARAWIRRLGASAPEVVMSWPRRQDEEPLRMSPVLKGLPAADDRIEPPPGVAEGQRAVSLTERYEDETGLPADGEVRGGTGLLKSQSECPFQAYARYRLRCKPLAQPGPGVDAPSRGKLLHEALRRFWTETRNQASLASMDAADRARRIRTAVEAAAEKVFSERPVPLAPVIRELETVQAATVIGELVARDMERTPFRTVKLEEWIDLAVGPLSLRGCVDRVDEVAGGYAVIDYKAGRAERAAWNGERPREPQVPVYALNLPGVVAVAFGSLKPGDVKYEGLALDLGAMGVVRPSRKDDGAAEWNLRMEEWRRVTGALAEAVAEGRAEVDPRNAWTTCEYCGLQALCRRDEVLAASEEGGDEEAAHD